MGDDKGKRREILLEVQVGKDEKIKVKVEPERTTLQPLHQLVGVLKHPDGHISCRDMQRTTIGGCMYAKSSFEQKGSICLQSVVGVKADKPTILVILWKIMIFPMGW